MPRAPARPDDPRAADRRSARASLWGLLIAIAVSVAVVVIAFFIEHGSR